MCCQIISNLWWPLSGFSRWRIVRYGLSPFPSSGAPWDSATCPGPHRLFLLTGSTVGSQTSNQIHKPLSVFPLHYIMIIMVLSYVLVILRKELITNNLLFEINSFQTQLVAARVLFFFANHRASKTVVHLLTCGELPSAVEGQIL